MNASTEKELEMDGKNPSLLEGDKIRLKTILVLWNTRLSSALLSSRTFRR
jgi:hypothetical protein